MVSELCEFANVDNEDIFIHPIIKGIIIHFILAYIHPFSDGNGRTARSLFYWYMIKKGYWLTEYLSISRIIYINKNGYCFKRPLGSRDIDDVGKDDLKGDPKELSGRQRLILSVIQNNDRITVLKMTKKLKPLIKLLDEKLLIILLRYIDFYALSQTDKNLIKQI